MVLHQAQVKPLRKGKHQTDPIRYNRPLLGNRVQMHTCKISNDLYQFTAVDDCTRMRVLGLYAKRTAENAVHFLRSVF